MTVRIVARPEPLIQDAVKAKALFAEPSPEETTAWWKDFPAPDAKPKPCAFCGGNFIRVCKQSEHAGCLNFAQVERRNQRREP